jgi:hypothetical protein
VSAFLSAVIDGIETAGPWAVWWVAVTTAVLVVVAVCRAGAAIGRQRHIRQGIRRLENYANHPGVRRLHDDIHDQREEDQA